MLDVTLQVKEQDQSVVVTEGAAQIETTDTQLGQVLGSKKVTEIPLNGRSYTDLFATQVGVTPLTTSGAGKQHLGRRLWDGSGRRRNKYRTSFRSTGKARTPTGFPSTGQMYRKASASKQESFRTSTPLPSFASSPAILKRNTEIIAVD